MSKIIGFSRRYIDILPFTLIPGKTYNFRVTATSLTDPSVRNSRDFTIIVRYADLVAKI